MAFAGFVENGNGADRQLRVFKETGDLTKVVDYIIEETETSVCRRTRERRIESGRLSIPEYSPGAHNAVHVCLRIQPEEKVTLITDRACLEIAASLAARAGQRWARRTTPSCSKNSRRGR